MEEEGCNFIEKSYLKNKLHWNLGKVPQVEHTHTPTHTRARARAYPGNFNPLLPPRKEAGPSACAHRPVAS